MTDFKLRTYNKDYRYWGYTRDHLFSHKYHLKELLNALYTDTIRRNYIKITSKTNSSKLKLLITVQDEE